jgi:hypothetical protein
MTANQIEPSLTDEQLNRLCEQLGLKAIKKNRILVAKLVDQAGTNVKKLAIALKKAMIAA